MRTKRPDRMTDQVRRIVRDSGLTLDQLANLTGIHKSTWSRFLNGERGLSNRALDKTGDVFGLQVTAKTPKPEAR